MWDRIVLLGALLAWTMSKHVNRANENNGLAKIRPKKGRSRTVNRLSTDQRANLSLRLGVVVTLRC